MKHDILEGQEINFLRTLEPNLVGEDYVLGDIHGHFRKLDDKLVEIGFDFDKDRLLVVGDLIDRGPHSDECIEYLKKDWFYSIKGNHEEFLVATLDYFFRGAPQDDTVGLITYSTWMGNGGRWIEDIMKEGTEADLREYFDALSTLPYFMEVPVGDKVVGLVHAELREVDSWNDIRNIAAGGDVPQHTNLDTILRDALWSRSRFEKRAHAASMGLICDDENINDVDAIFCGHTPMVDYAAEAPLTIGNHHYIDTFVYGTFENNFQPIKLSTFFEDDNSGE